MTERSLPKPRNRTRLGGAEVAAIVVDLEVVTPILGGGTGTRVLDEVDVIRVPTLRGHLRFWWRALRGHEFDDPQSLYEAESKLWGGAGGNTGLRSQVEVRVQVTRVGEVDQSDIDLQHTPGAYALWPARSQKEDSRRGRPYVPPAPRRKPGTRFRLTLTAPVDRETEVRNALRAWILFGGYGGRTRRGLGSLTVVANREDWLPGKPDRNGLKDCFGRDIFAVSERSPCDTAWLAGASLLVGSSANAAESAWTTALGRLKEFRQGIDGKKGSRAREPGTGKPKPDRPSISNWPEADKIWHLRAKRRAHPPRHNATPVWPRAGFGLPILGQFQTMDRSGGKRAYIEPGIFELRWRDGGAEHDRLASPLIVKALPLADGTFVPCALWLHRANPEGEVFLKGCYDSGAPFDLLVAKGDTAQFSALADKATLREAFLDWLKAQQGITEVIR